MKPTPGEWKYEDGFVYHDEFSNENVIAHLFNRDEVNLPNADADGTLMAAAPDLLHACQVAIGEIKQFPIGFTKEQIRNIIEKAIEKATA